MSLLEFRMLVAAVLDSLSAATNFQQSRVVVAPPLLGERAGVRAVQNIFNEAILPAVHV